MVYFIFKQTAMPFTKVVNLQFEEVQDVHWDSTDGRPKFYTVDLDHVRNNTSTTAFLVDSFLVYRAVYLPSNQDCLILIGYDSVNGHVFDDPADFAALGCPPFDRPGVEYPM